MGGTGGFPVSDMYGAELAVGVAAAKQAGYERRQVCVYVQ